MSPDPPPDVPFFVPPPDSGHRNSQHPRPANCFLQRQVGSILLGGHRPLMLFHQLPYYLSHMLLHAPHMRPIQPRQKHNLHGFWASIKRSDSPNIFILTSSINVTVFVSGPLINLMSLSRGLIVNNAFLIIPSVFFNHMIEN